MCRALPVLRALVLASILLAHPFAGACSPAPDYKPPSIEERFQAARTVALIRIDVPFVTEHGATVEVIELFKGRYFQTIFSEVSTCGLHPRHGETMIVFLDERRLVSSAIRHDLDKALPILKERKE